MSHRVGYASVARRDVGLMRPVALCHQLLDSALPQTVDLADGQKEPVGQSTQVQITQ